MAILDSEALSRTRSFVMDSGSTIWADADLQGGIRLALQEINLFSGQAYTINGLDSAVATTLPTLLDGVLVMGAGAMAATTRALDRGEAFELANEGGEVKGWGEKMLQSFRGQLDRMYPPEQTRTASQKAASAGPWGSWGDDFGEVGRETLD